jgi:hypothetical protein
LDPWLNSAVGRQLLLFAEPLLRAGLTRLLEEGLPNVRVCKEPEALEGSPQLLIWAVEAGIDAAALGREVARLSDLWQPAPLLLLLPRSPGLGREQLLALPAEGLLQAAQPQELLEAAGTLLAGGRVVQLAAGEPALPPPAMPALGLGQWLLISGLQQIETDLQAIDALLAANPANLLLVLALQGRRRELGAARALLQLLWGPVSLAWGSPAPAQAPVAAATAAGAPTWISLSSRTAQGSWEAIQLRLRERLSGPLANQSGQLLALEGLHPERRSDLLLALLEHLQLLRLQLQTNGPSPQALRQQWQALQSEVRQNALRRLAGPYVRLPQGGALQSVSDTLLQRCNLEGSDPELPDPQAMLLALVLGQPLLVDGQLLPPDAPLAVLHLEQLLANWLVRTAEQVASQVLGCCADWPELRRYLLMPELLATRNLERLRNQLNAQQRWSSWLERPVALYESRRPLLVIESNAIVRLEQTEPRDQELRQLGWPQQLVTLALESRDALAPQVHGLIRGLGRLLVVLLSEVLGRAIGLVGRGIVQGMGRSVGRSA